jgi:hypothetical protein
MPKKHVRLKSPTFAKPNKDAHAARVLISADGVVDVKDAPMKLHGANGDFYVWFIENHSKVSVKVTIGKFLKQDDPILKGSTEEWPFAWLTPNPVDIGTGAGQQLGLIVGRAQRNFAPLEIMPVPFSYTITVQDTSTDIPGTVFDIDYDPDLDIKP